MTVARLAPFSGLSRQPIPLRPNVRRAGPTFAGQGGNLRREAVGSRSRDWDVRIRPLPRLAWEHWTVQLHPIMYVSDQYAERAFYELFGFQRWYEGEEFPGFLAVRHGNAIIGLQRASPESPAYSEGLRWQFELETAAQLDEVTATCRKHQLKHEQHVEQGGERFATRMVSVRSPNGVLVWFEGPNEAATPSG